jgi:hypothetical protein
VDGKGKKKRALDFSVQDASAALPQNCQTTRQILAVDQQVRARASQAGPRIRISGKPREAIAWNLFRFITSSSVD